MKLQLEIAGRARVVEVQRDAQRQRVSVDGREHLVDAVRIGRDTWSLIITDPATGSVRSVEATVTSQAGTGVADVFIDGHRIPVAHLNGRGRRARGEGSAHGGGPQRLTAPMPGKVVRVLVSPGDEVQPRQGLVVIEAMKMENELRAAGAGRVRDVFVQEGQSVEAGTALVVVE
jgi:biotin carboxyl carrier protein